MSTFQSKAYVSAYLQDKRERGIIITLDKHLVLYFQMVHMVQKDFKIILLEKEVGEGKYLD